MLILHNILNESGVGLDEELNFDNTLKGTIFAYTTFSPDMFNELNKILSV
jgi:hypothetical protein